MTTMQSQKLRLYLYTAAICSTALLGCMANNIVGPLLGDIMRQYAISLDRGGMMSLYQNIGGVLSILLLAIVMDRLNKPIAMFAPFILLPVCLLLIGATPPYAVFMLLYLLFGISLSTMDMIGNAIMPDIHPEKRDAALSLLHGSAPVGALIVPLFAGALLDAGTPWQTAYTIIGIISVLLLLFYAVTFTMAKRTLHAERAQREGHEPGALKRILRDQRVLIAAGCVLLFGAFQSGVVVWTAQYCKEVFGVNAVLAGLPITVYWVATGIMRISFSFTRLKSLATRPVLLYGSIAAGVTLFLGLLSHSYAVLLVSIFVTGGLNAPVIPRAVGLATGWYPRNTGLSSSAVVTALYIAFGSAPFLMGAVAERFGIQVILYLPAAFTALAGVLAVFLPKEAKA